MLELGFTTAQVLLALQNEMGIPRSRQFHQLGPGGAGKGDQITAIGGCFSNQQIPIEAGEILQHGQRFPAPIEELAGTVDHRRGIIGRDRLQED